MPIEQQIDGPIVDGLYAALGSTYPPSLSNKFATFNDITNGGAATGVQGEVLFTADIVDIRNGVSAKAPVYIINYPVNAGIVDGRSRKLKYIFNYSKTSGNTTTQFEVIVGGITLVFPAASIGNGARNNDTYVLDIYINFRASNQAHVMAYLTRHDGSGNLNEEYTVKTTVLGTWDKTISNNIFLQYEILTGTATHTLTLQQVTSELI